MKIIILWVFIVLLVNQITFSQQGGIIGFESPSVIKIQNTSGNTENIYLFNYEGRPLKALQFKIVIGNTKLVLKSLSRGSSIPESSFLFDYEIHKGRLDSDGNPIEVINVVILGNAYNVLEPGSNYNLVSINYDIVDLDNDSVFTTIALQDVMGVTSSPVQDANIVSGGELELLIKQKREVVELVTLNQNYPNPFNPITTIKYSIPANDINGLQKVQLKVFDVLGNQITTLVDEVRPSGNYEVEFDASNLSSGIYFYSLNSENKIASKKMMLMK